jgi:hypothetical protein
MSSTLAIADQNSTYTAIERVIQHRERILAIQGEPHKGHDTRSKMNAHSLPPECTRANMLAPCDKATESGIARKSRNNKLQELVKARQHEALARREALIAFHAARAQQAAFTDAVIAIQVLHDQLVHPSGHHTMTHCML